MPEIVVSSEYGVTQGTLWQTIAGDDVEGDSTTMRWTASVDFLTLYENWKLYEWIVSSREDARVFGFNGRYRLEFLAPPWVPPDPQRPSEGQLTDATRGSDAMAGNNGVH